MVISRDHVVAAKIRKQQKRKHRRCNEKQKEEANKDGESDHHKIEEDSNCSKIAEEIPAKKLKSKIVDEEPSSPEIAEEIETGKHKSKNFEAASNSSLVAKTIKNRTSYLLKLDEESNSSEVPETTKTTKSERTEIEKPTSIKEDESHSMDERRKELLIEAPCQGEWVNLAISQKDATKVRFRQKIVDNVTYKYTMPRYLSSRSWELYTEREEMYCIVWNVKIKSGNKVIVTVGDAGIWVKHFGAQVSTDIGNLKKPKAVVAAHNLESGEIVLDFFGIQQTETVIGLSENVTGFWVLIELGKEQKFECFLDVEQLKEMISDSKLDQNEASNRKERKEPLRIGDFVRAQKAIHGVTIRNHPDLTAMILNWDADDHSIFETIKCRVWNITPNGGVILTCKLHFMDPKIEPKSLESYNPFDRYSGIVSFVDNVNDYYVLDSFGVRAKLPGSAIPHDFFDVNDINEAVIECSVVISERDCLVVGLLPDKSENELDSDNSAEKLAECVFKTSELELEFVCKEDDCWLAKTPDGKKYSLNRNHLHDWKWLADVQFHFSKPGFKIKTRVADISEPLLESSSAFEGEINHASLKQSLTSESVNHWTLSEGSKFSGFVVRKTEKGLFVKSTVGDHVFLPYDLQADKRFSRNLEQHSTVKGTILTSDSDSKRHVGVCSLDACKLDREKFLQKMKSMKEGIELIRNFFLGSMHQAEIITVVDGAVTAKIGEVKALVPKCVASFKRGERPEMLAGTQLEAIVVGYRYGKDFEGLVVAPACDQKETNLIENQTYKVTIVYWCSDFSIGLPENVNQIVMLKYSPEYEAALVRIVNRSPFEEIFIGEIVERIDREDVLPRSLISQSECERMTGTQDLSESFNNDADACKGIDVNEFNNIRPIEAGIIDVSIFYLRLRLNDGSIGKMFMGHYEIEGDKNWEGQKWMFAENFVGKNIDVVVLARAGGQKLLHSFPTTREGLKDMYRLTTNEDDEIYRTNLSNCILPEELPYLKSKLGSDGMGEIHGYVQKNNKRFITFQITPFVAIEIPYEYIWEDGSRARLQKGYCMPLCYKIKDCESASICVGYARTFSLGDLEEGMTILLQRQDENKVVYGCLNAECKCMEGVEDEVSQIPVKDYFYAEIVNIGREDDEACIYYRPQPNSNFPPDNFKLRQQNSQRIALKRHIKAASKRNDSMRLSLENDWANKFKTQAKQTDIRENTVQKEAIDSSRIDKVGELSENNCLNFTWSDDEESYYKAINEKSVANSIPYTKIAKKAKQTEQIEDISKSEHEEKEVEEKEEEKEKVEKEEAKVETNVDSLQTSKKTALDVDKSVVSKLELGVKVEPDNVKHWLNIIDYYVQLSDIGNVRSICRRGIAALDDLKYDEKLLIWTRLLKAEVNLGSSESVQETFTLATNRNNPLKTHFVMADIWEENSNFSKAAETYKLAIKKFKTKKQTWIKYLEFLFRNKKFKDGADLISASFPSLTNQEHVDIILKKAELEFKYGEKERGKTNLEHLLSTYPKRTDVWSIYLDLLIAAGDYDDVRSVFSRILALNLRLYKLKPLFKNYLRFERNYGSEESYEKWKNEFDSRFIKTEG